MLQPAIETMFLKPLSVVYGWGVRLRNVLFDRGVLKQEQYPIPVICIGNIRIGGTGKTPMVEYLLGMLIREGYRPAVVSRGYKRSSSGLQIVHVSSSALEVGDEPRQIKQKYPSTTVVVDANRRRAITRLLELDESERPNVVLLDDGFQHRYVLPSLSILLTDHDHPLCHDDLLPLGRLRENCDARHRADVVVVTRCPAHMQPIDYSIIERNLALYPHQKLLFSSVGYSTPIRVFPTTPSIQKLTHMSGRALAIAGIANPTKFFREIKHKIPQVETLSFSDHHRFGPKDADLMNRTFGSVLGSTPSSQYPIAICTEKDAQRLSDIRHLLSPALVSNLYYLPIHTVFREYATISMDQIVLNHIRDFYRKPTSPYI
ncbi:tetraacyldisaccharide 4'-kinase [Porphyromonas crevioricanis JCM 15906]|uniref:Tetraacyldisaccharide 4'-kinase n=2 Tax=Porphyromonas crevioricanis TaxID=393921 RepID=A0A2X4PZ89_9PORP|nr:tetraacyldisaccharide 4'-kinase [Porphyromonas crevioricanis]GAD05284.1 tetraacyldisaccharide 4'-kinase [Porphyromonas crevioricanis JCM 15906]GAD06638.1 tetraacyldisaccharide 4'-kinase [Porphyromonas crevioricanis JCM 13913]SJZ52595.1 lipid-A-disaccharide kinase [Porphyromonas crevioricanis]SQH73217.1 Tetraacyldisaccharide 4'-kinase [Porphyromonas crevioricanis]